MEIVNLRPQDGACWRGLAELEPQVRAFARRRCRDMHELDDVVQETLLRAARYRRGLTDETRLKSWTLRIAANVMRDRLDREACLGCAGVGFGWRGRDWSYEWSYDQSDRGDRAGVRAAALDDRAEAGDAARRIRA